MASLREKGLLLNNSSREDGQPPEREISLDLHRPAVNGLVRLAEETNQRQCPVYMLAVSPADVKVMIIFALLINLANAHVD